MKVLIVEDEAIISRLLALYFTGQGHNVDTAADGLAALEQFDSFGPELILLDVGLPKLSGWEVLRTLRERSRVPVILLTALDDADDVARGFQLGADDYIRKPFQLPELDMHLKPIFERLMGSE
jgi:DNA-binding response OmpR family regulator